MKPHPTKNDPPLYQTLERLVVVIAIDTLNVGKRHFLSYYQYPNKCHIDGRWGYALNTGFGSKCKQATEYR